jgi:hypothetical protein
VKNQVLKISSSQGESAMNLQESINLQEATNILRSGFGKELVKIATSYVAPFFWEEITDDGNKKFNNGSIFFLDCGAGTFAVTANHVYQGYLDAKAAGSNVTCQVSNAKFIPEKRLIDRDKFLDIATFKVSLEEIMRIGKLPLRGSQSSWPPLPPELGKGVFFAGFPGKERIFTKPVNLNFGIYSALCIAETVNEFNISCQFEHEFNIEIDGIGVLPSKNYDAGGISGAPLLTLVEHNKIFSWRLGGVIYEASSEFEIIFARRADYILSDGKLRK